MLKALLVLKVGLSRLRKFLPKISPAFVRKETIIVCLVFKIENKWILKLQNL